MNELVWPAEKFAREVMPEFGFKNEIAARIARFLRVIGVAVEPSALQQQTILPGIQLDRGILLADEARLLHPGDLLHEAGHIAVTPAAQRRELCGDVGQGPAEEMAAIAWSYAAAIHLGLDPSVVFHADGYRGGSKAILENFKEGRYIGVPILQWLGMTLDEKKAREVGAAAYPAMVKWLRD